MKRLALPNVVACAPRVGNALEAQKGAASHGVWCHRSAHAASEIRIVHETGTVVFADRVETTASGLGGGVCAAAAATHPDRERDGERMGRPVCGRQGHDVIVADPNDAPMYGHRNRRVKTDKRNVAAPRPVGSVSIRPWRGSAPRTRRQELRVRRHLVEVRKRTINRLGTLVHQDGLRIPRGGERLPAPRLRRHARAAAGGAQEAADGIAPGPDDPRTDCRTDRTAGQHRRHRARADDGARRSGRS